MSLACASLLVDELVRGGLSDACVSPGSRSTPLALALARHDGVRVHVHLDERSSAFFALGLAKASGRPVAVATTSGTAAAELLPAVVEASQSRTPLILLTADRPPRLRGTGANQTIDQVELFGKYARYLETPLPAEGEGSTWRRTGIDAIAAALRRPRGPVHLNLPFDEPLVPEGEDVDAQDPGALLTPVALARIHQEPRGMLEPAEVDRLAAELVGAERGAIVLGACASSPEDEQLLARRLGWPLLAEPVSNGREPELALAAGQALLGSPTWLAEHRPEVVLQLGAAPTTRATQAFAASAERLVVVDDGYLDPDPEQRATRKLHASSGWLAAELNGARLPSREPGPWLEAWLQADAATRAAMDELMDSWEEPFEPRVARDLAALVPNGGTLVAGSSTPIRDLDLVMAPREGLRVLANRGASGIDGFVSTVLGVAVTGRPTFALMGDLTFLYDIGALLWNARRGLSAVLVVLNNGGGGIFDLLPQRELPEFEELWLTAPWIDLAPLVAATGVRHARVTRANELAPAVEQATTLGGIHVVEVKCDRRLGLARREELRSAVAGTLAAL